MQKTNNQTPPNSLKSPNGKRKSLDPSGPETPSSYENRILEWIDETFEMIIYPDGFEDCIVGVGERCGGPPVAVLDIEKMFKKLEKQGMTHDEAVEYFEFNVLGAHVGEQNPVYMHVPNFQPEKKTSTRKRKA